METTKTRFRLKPEAKNAYYTPDELRDKFWATPTGRTAPNDPTYLEVNVYTSHKSYPTPEKFTTSDGRVWRLLDTVYLNQDEITTHYEKVTLS
jgi:hypothetical protein